MESEGNYIEAKKLSLAKYRQPFYYHMHREKKDQERGKEV
jgi:hypothetical protein